MKKRRSILERVTNEVESSILESEVSKTSVGESLVLLQGNVQDESVVTKTIESVQGVLASQGGTIVIEGKTTVTEEETIVIDEGVQVEAETVELAEF